MRRLANCYPKLFPDPCEEFFKVYMEFAVCGMRRQPQRRRDTEKKDLVTTESTEVAGKNQELLKRTKNQSPCRPW